MNYVFDIDGTLSKVGTRIECLNRTPKNWDEFYERCGEDEPNEPIVAICRALICYGVHHVWFLTGRRESCRRDTDFWLIKHHLEAYNGLIMRPDGDFRHDTIVKPELMAAAGLTPENVTAIFEDRNSMVEQWRKMGFTCLQVADGNF